MKTFPFGIAVIGALGACTVSAHYTWVASVEGPLEVGKTSTVRISHGHKFPQSEEAINASQVELFVLPPSGARIKLDAATSGTAVTAKYAVKEAGLHRIVMLQDRGVASRTPKGVQQGGRDKHPDAVQAYRTFRSAVAYATTAKSAVAGAQPAGLEFELAGQYSNGAWQLQLLKQGKPVPDVPIEVFIAGAAEASQAGRTASNGGLTYRPPAGAKGPAMFSAEVKQAPPAGAKYDAINYSTSLYVSW